MRSRFLPLLIVLILVPLAIVTWLGVRLTRGEHDADDRRVVLLAAERLADADDAITRVLDERRKRILELTAVDGVSDAELAPTLRRLQAEDPTVRQLFALAADGTPLHPIPGATATDDEATFFERAWTFWGDAGGLDAAGAAASGGSGDGEAGDHAESAAPMLAGDRREGWHTWFWDRGVHLIFWHRDVAGRIVGAELDRVRLMADVIAALPDTDPDDPAVADDRIVLRDARGAVLYQWGMYEVPEDAEPLVQRAVSTPLAAWRLEYHMSPEGLAAATGGSGALGLALGLAALVLSLGGLGTVLVRERSRELRDSEQRVNFVNRVSHELKTPLTNIRLYAELLQRRVDPDDERAQRQLGIIASESQRLGRLIGNVLTFARHERHALTLHPTDVALDEILDEVLDQFALALADERIEVSFERGAPACARLDRDLVTQVAANLISNVEKYAAGGKALILETSQATADGQATLVIRDRGPGVRPADAARIFEPFERASDKITEGVSGAGIGLALARELCRLHGGDLTLQPSPSGETGACFRATFAPIVEATIEEDTP